MNNSIYPCLWFDTKGAEAAAFYCSVFSNTKMISQNPIVSKFELDGTMFMTLNGGPKYGVNEAVSYYVYCSSEEEITRLSNILSEDGKILMPLGKYNWAEQYIWVIDRYGVNWQLDRKDINSSQKIVPSCLFSLHKKTWVLDAIRYYTSIVENSKILLTSPYAPEANLPQGSLLFAQFKLNDFIMNAMSNPMDQGFDFTPGNSFVIECDTQEEIDHYWDELGKDGRYEMCGWLVDKMGISWQIVPRILGKLMSNPDKAKNVMNAFLKMQKFDIATLLNA